MEQFIRHLLCDVLSRKTLDNVLKLLRKLHWEDAEVSVCQLPEAVFLNCSTGPAGPLQDVHQAMEGLLR
jgi:hypothetical protein